MAFDEHNTKLERNFVSDNQAECDDYLEQHKLIEDIANNL